MVKINNIILIGMPYSGKSTIGEHLSRKMGLEFLDTDNMIEKKYEDNIENIIKSKGEAYFRRLERKLIEELTLNNNNNNLLIATGGGMPIYFNNLFMLKNLGTLIFLDTNIKTIIKRASINNNRPLVKNNFQLSLLDLYYFRFNVYSHAHIHVCLEEEMPEKQAQQIIDLL